MEYSNETEEYETTFTFQYPGEYPYSIVCQDYPYHENGTGSGVVSIKNRLPVLIANISNVTIQQGFSTTFVDLDNHFIDPGGELITFHHHLIHTSMCLFLKIIELQLLQGQHSKEIPHLHFCSGLYSD